MRRWLTRFVAALLVATVLCACATLPSPQQRRQHADALAAAQAWQASRIAAGPFELLAYLPRLAPPADTLTVYLEGDGFAWVSGSQPSTDPTPTVPMGLQLALAQPAGAAAYLARPCQYQDTAHTVCSERYWTTARFAPEVVEASSVAIDDLKRRFAARWVNLVGYSGGGAVAALVAARRSDVLRLVTVVGNLDHQAWTRFHRIEPLTGSLNPANEVAQLGKVRQWHFTGGKDQVMPPQLAQAYASRFASDQPPAVEVKTTFDHQCCWVEAWPLIWNGIAP